MYQVYKPSGKISVTALFTFLAVFFFFVPAVSFLTAIVLWYCPSTIINIILFADSVYILVKFSSKLFVYYGKVRNPHIARLSSILIGGLYFYIIFTVYYLINAGAAAKQALFLWAISKPQLSALQAAEALFHPFQIIKGWKTIIETGISITTKTGSSFFILKGNFFLVLIGIIIFITILCLVYKFGQLSRQPFCEASKKWAEKYTLHLQYIENCDELLKRLLFGQTDCLRELEVLKTVNCSYCEMQLYVTENNNSFYATMTNQKLTEKKKAGELEFDEENIIKLIQIDKDTGNILLSKLHTNLKEVVVAVSTEEVRKEQRKQLLKTAALSVILIGFYIFSLYQMDSLRQFFSNPVILFYSVITIFVYTISFLKCFAKENTIVIGDNQLSYSKTRAYLAEKCDAPIGYKIYYGSMAIINLLIFILCIKESL